MQERGDDNGQDSEDAWIAGFVLSPILGSRIHLRSVSERLTVSIIVRYAGCAFAVRTVGPAVKLFEG